MPRKKTNAIRYKNRECKVYAKADGRWLVQWREGPRWRTTTRSNETDARQWAREKVRAMANDEPMQASLEQRRLVEELMKLSGGREPASWALLEDVKNARQVVNDEDITLTDLAEYWKENCG